MYELIRVLKEFQSTLPRGERQRCFVNWIRKDRFQSTLPRGERLYQTGYHIQAVHHFNPRSREGSDKRHPDLWNKLLISIHAPARGATQLVHTSSASYYISIHAPARGATSHITFVLSVYENFNPRSREGSDTSHRCDTQIDTISIHAPARGATQ